MPNRMLRLALGRVPDRVAEYAKRYNRVVVLPFYEKGQADVLYNTAVVLDADGSDFGKY